MFVLAPMLLAAVVACSGDRDATGPELDRPRGDDVVSDPKVPAQVQLLVSSTSAAPGTRVALGLTATTQAGEPLLAVLGALRFDPARLRYVGLPADSTTTVAANPSDAATGRLRLIVVRPRGLADGTPLAVFEVLAADYAATVSFALEEGVTGEPAEAEAALARGARGTGWVVPALREATRPAADLGGARRPSLSLSGGAERYGDADGDGGVAQADVDLVVNWVVQNGAPPDTLAFNRANPAPENLPGLGGPTDDDAPGWQADCTRRVSTLDAALIGNEVAGTEDYEVVGSAIPTGSIIPSRCIQQPVNPNSLTFPDDSTHVIPDPTVPGVVLYRTMAAVNFRSTATGADVAAFLAKYGATIVGGTELSGTYIIAFPDPGSTWTAVDALMQRMAAEPVVELIDPAPRFEAFPAVDSRNPTDGAGLSRSSWSTSSDSVWAMNAIRAPLAWGCETGLYGGTAPRIGVVEWDFFDTHSDLATSRMSNLFRTKVSGGVTLTPASYSNLRYHGLSVMSVLSAEGDNGVGIAGTMWRTDLRRYALTPGASVGGGVRIQAPAFELALKQAQSDGVKVLSLSIPIYTLNVKWQSRLKKAIRKFLDGSGALIVKATGNSAVTMNAQQLASMYLENGLSAALMDLKLNDGYGDRILFVGGTARSGGAWPSANVLVGGTDIVAPAEMVAVLGSPELTGPRGSAVVLDNGTSLSAPMVAGVAAQLIAMDPTLTPAEVTRYLLRGADSVRRVNPAGDSVPPVAVLNAPGPVYQLDAYSSLTLLARERNTPICGQQVSLSGLNFVIEGRPPIPVATPSAPSWVGVAPGGRKVAVSSFQGLAVYDHRGNVLEPLRTGVQERQFLERTVADYTLVDYPDDLSYWGFSFRVTYRSNSGAYLSGPTDYFAVHPPSTGGRVGTTIRVSPSGEFVALTGQYEVCPEGEATYRFGVIGTTSQQEVFGVTRTWNCGRVDDDFEFPSGAAWSQDSREAAFVFYRPDGGGPNVALSTVVRYGVTGAVDSFTVAGRTVLYPHYSADGALIHADEEGGLGACWTTVRTRTGSLVREVRRPDFSCGNPEYSRRRDINNSRGRVSQGARPPSIDRSSLLRRLAASVRAGND